VAVKRKEIMQGGGRCLFDHRIVVNVPVLFMKGLLTAGVIPVSNRAGFYGVIPKLALLLPINLFGNDLGGLEGRGRVLGGPSTFRRMTIRICTDTAFVGLRSLRFWGRGNIVGCAWGTKSGGTAFTTPLGPVVRSSAFAVRL
jgi:hypothetical protein